MYTLCGGISAISALIQPVVPLDPKYRLPMAPNHRANALCCQASYTLPVADNRPAPSGANRPSKSRPETGRRQNENCW